MGEKSFLDRAAEQTYEELKRGDGNPSKLNLPKQTVAILYSVQAIIDSGGFQYFFEGDFPFNPPYSTFVEAYRRIGSDQAAERLEKAIGMFPFENPQLHKKDWHLWRCLKRIVSSSNSAIKSVATIRFGAISRATRRKMRQAFP